MVRNIIEVRDANGFMGADVPVGSYAMLFDYSGSSFSLYGIGQGPDDNGEMGWKFPDDLDTSHKQTIKPRKSTGIKGIINENVVILLIFSLLPNPAIRSIKKKANGVITFILSNRVFFLLLSELKEPCSRSDAKTIKP